jgi:hypothetical protein
VTSRTGGGWPTLNFASFAKFRVGMLKRGRPGSGLTADAQISQTLLSRLNSVIPTGTDHRKAMICEVEGPWV